MVLAFFSCSKEENVPFQDSVKDTITHVSYKDISGVYEGTMYQVEFISNIEYARFNAKSHSVTVSELDFDNVFLSDISSDVQSDAQAVLYRFNLERGYMSFIIESMADSIGYDSIFSSTLPLNGIYYYDENSLQYFIYYIENGDTVRQEFVGNRL